ncbi:MAG: hypothetical protein ABJM36_07010 [Algibacter sp.]|uniref:lipopolysaccharide biosynthesis protein n=1 Tax=Algibacter sp. TaxID=1872428 RepID=UPI003299551F
MIKIIKNKQFHNYFSGLVLKLCLVLSQLFLIPVFINDIGVDTYGEWLILTTIPNYLLLSDFGLTLTVTNEICRLINLNEYSSQEKLFKGTLSFLSIIGISLIFIFLIVSLFVDFSTLFKFVSLSKKDSFLILGGFMVNIFMFLIFRVTIGYFKALNLFHKHEYFLALTLFLDFVTTLILLKLKAPLFYIPFTMAVIRLVMLFVMNIILSKFKYYKFGFTLDWSKAVSMLPTSLKLSFFQLGSALFIQGSTFLVGMVLGPANVVIFNTIRTMVNSLKAFIGILYVPSMQEFTIMITKKLKDEALIKLKKLMLLVFSVSFIFCLVIFFLRDIIFELWLKNSFSYNTLFLGFMLCSVLIHNLWNAGSMVPMSINKMNELALYPVLGIGVLVVQYFILSKTGLAGLAAGFIIMDLIMLLLVLRLDYKIIKNI